MVQIIRMSVRVRTLLVLVTFQYFICVIPGNNLGMLGKVDIIFRSFEICDGPPNLLDITIGQRKYNRTTSLLDVTMDTPVDFGDNLVVELKGWLKKEGGYKPGSFYKKGKACENLVLLLGNLFEQLLDSIGQKCPMAPGNYVATDFFLDNDSYDVPMLYGEHKMEMWFFDGDKTLSCNNAYFETVPKEQR